MPRVTPMTKRMGVVAVFLVGCAVGGVSSQVVVPKASAQQAATLTKWEYFCETQFAHTTAASANKLGEQRWEMVGVSVKPGNELAACYKRPKM